MRTMAAWGSSLLALGFLVAACGGTFIEGVDGGGPESGGADGGVVCGATPCGAGETCCAGCHGSSFCSGPGGECPGIECAVEAGPPPPDAPVDSPKEGASDAPEGGGCRTTSDCSMSGYCATPEDPPCSGVCMIQKNCTSDGECSGGNVCREGSHIQDCGGDAGGSFCLPPCAGDADCRGFEQCSSGHCVTRSCSTCPSYLSCTSGSCAPASCSSDANCPGGYCVDGSCYGSLGTCMGLCA